MNKINYPKIEEYNKENSFYDYIENYIKQFKNKKDKIEFSYLCAKDIIELTKKDKGLYQNCTKCLELIELWLKDENSIDIKKLKLTTDSINNFIYYFNDSIDKYNPALSIVCSALYVVYFGNNEILSIDPVIYPTCSVCDVYHAKPELLPYIQKLIQMYLREEKQFNIKEHNNTYHESILKQIVNTEYEQLQDIDKNQTKDIINEYYDIEIDCFDFLVYKTIQREFL